MQTAVSQRCSGFAGSFAFLTRRLRAPCLCLHGLIFAALVLSSPLTFAVSDPFTEAQFIAGLGANQLVLEKIERQQTRAGISANEWLRWEHLRIELYNKTAAWQTLIERVDAQQKNIPAAAQDWFATQQVSAWLEQGNGLAARKVLQKIIWSGAAEKPAANLQVWRELVIRSYLLDNQANAAYTAMLRHNQDYPDATDDAKFLRAKVLLQAGRAKDAADLLEKSSSVQAKSLYLLAALRSATLPAKNVMSTVKDMLKAKGLYKDVRLRLWAVITEASYVENDLEQHAEALEEIFSETRASQLDDGLIKLAAESLWQVYSQNAQAAGNQQNLLIGDDEKWFVEADKNKKDPVRQRSIYALLIESASSEASRLRAHDGLVKSLQQREQGIEVIRRLYLHAPRYSDYAGLPAIVHYTLLEQALSESDVVLASRLMQGLQVAPEGIDPLLWDMRRARVFVMAGDITRGSEVLNKVLDGESVLNKTATDRFMQVVFDLQTLGEHDKAYALFDKLLRQAGNFQLQREILFWMGDSRKAQKMYADAAVLYLRSADVPGQSSPDLWGQSALYQAAEALVEANLVSDAKRIYSQLLTLTKDEARRAVLQRKLQQLWLRDNRG